MQPKWLSSSARSLLAPTTTTFSTPTTLKHRKMHPSPSHFAVAYKRKQFDSHAGQLCQAERGGSSGPVADAGVTVSLKSIKSKKSDENDDDDQNEPQLLSPAATQIAALCDSGMPDAELCELVADAPPSATAGADFLKADGGSVAAEAWSRGKWLLGLLILQSTSSLVLDSYADLLREHIVVTLFLTMLVGAGGNAGNQSAIHVIRGLATGALDAYDGDDFSKTMLHQARVGALLATGLGIAGFARVFLSTGSAADSSAISASLVLIVLASVGVGSALPFGLARAGVDPANAGTSVQVAMDILGCAITCVTCSIVLGRFAEALSSTSAVAAVGVGAG